jgi:hypothetical protein
MGRWKNPYQFLVGEFGGKNYTLPSVFFVFVTEALLLQLLLFSSLQPLERNAVWLEDMLQLSHYALKGPSDVFLFSERNREFANTRRRNTQKAIDKCIRFV